MQYFEFDGKQFGYGGISEEIGEFRGARKITSLPVYPLKYHKNEEQLRKMLIERGKKFVALGGVHYKSHQGMAYLKKKKAVVKVNINGRVMVDPAIYRRINPNYPISHIRPQEHDSSIMGENDDDDDDDSEAGCGGNDSSDEGPSRGSGLQPGFEAPSDHDDNGDDDDNDGLREATKILLTVDKHGGGVVNDGMDVLMSGRKIRDSHSADTGREPLASVTAKYNGGTTGDSSGAAAPTPESSTASAKLKHQGKKSKKRQAKDAKDANHEATDDKSGKTVAAKSKASLEFTDEEYLIASPVVLGFAFAEKLWLEFTVSGVGEISWNELAYESLVLEPKTKDIVKALVESHKYHAAESIDDVIQGKGKGLVAVLHGPPGTGKTLTAEGISELLKCPLYMVSAGELGTDSRFLELELQKILDICHAWGAILLLDEADVFLEKRNMHDLHRNALVSIFLRQLEYFQGILFLTTNRVEVSLLIVGVLECWC